MCVCDYMVVDLHVQANAIMVLNKQTELSRKKKKKQIERVRFFFKEKKKRYLLRSRIFLRHSPSLAFPSSMQILPAE